MRHDLLPPWSSSGGRLFGPSTHSSPFGLQLVFALEITSEQNGHPENARGATALGEPSWATPILQLGCIICRFNISVSADYLIKIKISDVLIMANITGLHNSWNEGYDCTGHPAIFLSAGQGISLAYSPLRSRAATFSLKQGGGDHPVKNTE